MKKLLISFGLVIAAGLAVAGTPDVQVLSITTVTNGGDLVVCTNGLVRGEIDEIIIDHPSATDTGNVTIAAIQYATGTAIILATNATCSADQTFRTSLDRTDNAGSALTSDPPAKYIAVGENLEFRLSGYFRTNVTWKAIIKFSR